MEFDKEEILRGTGYSVASSRPALPFSPAERRCRTRFLPVTRNTHLSLDRVRPSHSNPRSRVCQRVKKKGQRVPLVRQTDEGCISIDFRYLNTVLDRPRVAIGVSLKFLTSKCRWKNREDRERGIEHGSLFLNESYAIFFGFQRSLGNNR